MTKSISRLKKKQALLKRQPLRLVTGNYNTGQNIWNKIEKSSKTGQDKKILISTFA